MLGLVVNETDPDDGIMSGGDSGERTVYTGALQVLDQLAMHVGAEKIIGSCAPKISQLLSDSAPNSQRAGLLILSVIVEGCGDLIQASYLDQLVPAVCQHMQNPEEKVRSAAYFTIGQFAEHLVPDINDYRVVFPKCRILGVKRSFEGVFWSKNVISRRFWVKTCHFRSFWA